MENTSKCRRWLFEREFAWAERLSKSFFGCLNILPRVHGLVKKRPKKNTFSLLSDVV